jgi:hypothetical protein
VDRDGLFESDSNRKERDKEVVYIGDKEGRDSGREGKRGRERRRDI